MSSSSIRSDCTDYEYVQWTDPSKIVSLSVLLFIDVLVIVGNCLVIAAVFCSHKLRSVTNFFIVSLAVADLLVGIAVLPFSATWEVYQVWIFGELWCQIWLAVDVWMCTASILNLCAISLDRYVAVTRPVTYPSIMSTKRAKLLVLGVWVLSFVICLPPLVGFNNKSSTLSYTASLRPGDRYSRDNHTLILLDTGGPSYPTDTDIEQSQQPCPLTCELTNNAGYVVYSALGSFYLPMLVMLFFYWRIYRAAVRTTRAINQGFKTTKGSKQNKIDQPILTLRIHRGRRSNSVPRVNPKDAKSNLKVSKSIDTTSLDRRVDMLKATAAQDLDGELMAHKSPILHMMQITLNRKENMETFLCAQQQQQQQKQQQTPGITPDVSSEPIPEEGHPLHSGSSKSKRGAGRRVMKVQAKRFRMETKAAKTLALIVGGFICCWLPFFTIYLVRPFCKSCIQPMVFSVLFWLGYCNSALNPLIYALFSKDFRLAFKTLICKCFCSSLHCQSSQMSSGGSSVGENHPR